MARHGSVLLLADDHPGHANTILDQLKAIHDFSAHRIHLFNPRGVKASRTLGLGDFDAVIIHWSLVIISESYLSASFVEKLRRYQGPKILMIQDDYRWVNRMTAAMRDLDIDILFTLVPEREIPKIWSEAVLPGVRKITYLAGYVPEHLVSRPVSPIAHRPLDLVYRGRELPYWLGKLGQEKIQIARGVSARAEAFSLRVDVAFREGERIYGEDWINFIASARATLGTESGSTITDFDGSVERNVREYRAHHPEATFEEVHAAVLAPVEGNVMMNVISPRIFEAAALRTALVLFPGEYSGVLQPHRHYIPLEKDFSNFAEVVEKLRDTAAVQALVDRTYDEIARSEAFSLQGFIKQLDDAIETAPGFRAQGRYPYRLQLARLENRLRPSTQVARGRLPNVVRYIFHIGLVMRTLWENPSLWRPLLVAVLRGRLHLSALPGLAADLIRFRLLRDAAQGLVLSGAPFYLTVHLGSAERGAVLTSLPGIPRPMTLERADDLDNVRLTWNHSVVGNHLPSSWGFPGDTIGIGVDGIHEFENLSLLGPEPGQVIARAATLGKTGSLPLREFAGKMTVYVPRALVSLRETLKSREGRGLVWAWLVNRNLRDSVGLNHLMGDILKLRCLGEVIRKRPGFSIERTQTGDGLTFRSVLDPGAGAAAPPTPPAPSRITWDHRSVGSRLDLGPLTGDRLELVMGEEGIHTFPALDFVARRYPERLSRLLEEFLG